MCTDKRSIPKEDTKNYSHYSPRSPKYIELGVVVSPLSSPSPSPSRFSKTLCFAEDVKGMYSEL